MLNFLPGPLVGIIASLLYLINIIIFPTLILLIALIKLFTPIKSWRNKLSNFLHEGITNRWVAINRLIMKLTCKTKIETQGHDELKLDQWYFLVSNHLSALDILILEDFFAGKIPMLSFFIKKELLWTLPVASWAAYVMGFPFMQRYSKSYLKKHPEKKGKDMETTKKACKKFKNHPITVINFVEGTRCTPEKQLNQNSPYTHLLRPKAGGVSFVLDALEDCMHHLINVTIIYPDRDTTFWRFLCGKIDKVILRYDVQPILADIIGDYYGDKNFRVHFQNWLNTLWQEKDELIHETLKKESP